MKLRKRLIEDFGLDIKIEDRNKYKRTHRKQEYFDIKRNLKL